MQDKKNLKHNKNETCFYYTFWVEVYLGGIKFECNSLGGKIFVGGGQPKKHPWEKGGERGINKKTKSLDIQSIITISGQSVYFVIRMIEDWVDKLMIWSDY